MRYFTRLREITGKKDETLELARTEKVTVNLVLKRLSEHYGKDFTEYVYDSRSRKVRGFLQFLINGKSATTLDGLDTKLANGDVLAILPPVGGG